MRSPPLYSRRTSAGCSAAAAPSNAFCPVRRMADATESAAVSAPRKRTHRLRYSIIALLCIGAVAWMLVLMQRNVVFFKTVSQAVADREHDGTRNMRIGGAVVPDSIHMTSDG